MTATVATDLKANLKHFIDIAVGGDCVIITRPKSKNAVLISENEYNELLRIKANAEYLKKLDRSVKELESGNVVIKSMAELEALAEE